MNKFIHSKLDKLWNLGVVDGDPVYLIKQIRISNRISLLLAGLTAPYMFLFWYSGLSLAVRLDSIFLFSYCALPCLNAWGLHRYFRYLLFFVGLLQIITVSYLLGEGAGIHNFIYLAMTATMFFSSEGWSFIFFGIGMTIACCRLTFYLYSKGAYYHFSDSFMWMMYHGSFCTALIVIFGFAYYFYAESKRSEAKLEEAKKRTEDLLLNILPQNIANRLLEGEKSIADKFENVYVIFSDIVNFTEMSSRMTAVEVVQVLNSIFSEFDQLIDQSGMEKIKTIGDAYLAIDLTQASQPGRVSPVIDVGLGMLEAVKKVSEKSGRLIKIRIGIHSGPIVAGVIGRTKYIYDIWGDTVNTASRMEAMSQPGWIHVSEPLYQSHKEKYRFKERGWIEVKGKGQMLTYWVEATNGSGDT